MPAPVVFAGQRLPASYANFYIANDRVLVPTFNDPHDRRALGILAELFPGREVVGIHAVDLVWGLGTLHCLTQQQPLGGQAWSKASPTAYLPSGVSLARMGDLPGEASFVPQTTSLSAFIRNDAIHYLAPLLRGTWPRSSADNLTILHHQPGWVRRGLGCEVYLHRLRLVFVDSPSPRKER